MGNWQNTKDKNLIDAHFTATPIVKMNQFNARYKKIFKNTPPRVASLAYDAVSLVSVLAKHHALTENNLTQENGFNGVNGRFRLNPDGTNSRLLEIFKITPKLQYKSVSPEPDAFITKDQMFFPPVITEDYFEVDI